MDNDILIDIILFLSAVFIIYEIQLTIRSRNKELKTIRQENDIIGNIRKLLQQRDEDLFSNLSEEERKYPALDYLSTCAQKEQQVNEENFKELLISNSNTAFSNINSTMNRLPIIGLMGTFLGIIIGVIKSSYEINTLNSVNPENFNLAESIIPLLFSAGLAFSSSLCALFCASLLKWFFGKERNKSDEEIDSTLKALVVDYIPYISPKSTEDRFSKTVIRLNNTINKFVENFEDKLTGFISNFQPLVENQKQTNAETLKSMEDIAIRLNQDYEIMKQLSTQQENQINSFSDVTEKLKNASSSMEETIKFDDYKHMDVDGIEFWQARELQPLLDYSKWSNFNKVIKTAMIACKISNHDVDDHFIQTTKQIELAKTAQRKIID